jgi:hypothetical protein
MAAGSSGNTNVTDGSFLFKLEIGLRRCALCCDLWTVFGTNSNSGNFLLLWTLREVQTEQTM